MIRTKAITVTGLVQGVGFRPFVYRLALRNGLTGWVLNTNRDVQVCVTGEEVILAGFAESLRSEAPSASIVEEVITEERDLEIFEDFIILPSRNLSEDVTGISPDIAVCPACLEDLKQPGPRHDYPFVNCTHCGPRFTIIRDLPYDRAATTMAPFAMCPACREEYGTITDRRFHAQPVACSDCGPRYELWEKGIRTEAGARELTRYMAGLIEGSGVVLIKGLGGMHLACNAFDEGAAMRLRGVKSREGKPFAVMFRDLESVKQYCEVSPQEEVSLTSWRRPIVLLREKNQAAGTIPSAIHAGLGSIGVMLPYLPFHHMLFEELKTPAIVLTSGNLSSEPIIIYDEEALRVFGSRVDALLLHNRAIYNRADDSVVRIMEGRERIFRRSRGYVPTALSVDFDAEGIVAFGAELTNCFCVGKGKKAVLSQHIGDLQELETESFFREAMDRFINLFRINTVLCAADLHPAYLSTKIAHENAGVPVLVVQHHHAHIASCMAEHSLTGPVIGVAMDGTGFGDDGHTWGSEFLICDYEGYERISHLAYLPQPGGDQGAEEPWRMAVAWLYTVYGSGFLELGLPFLDSLEADRMELLTGMIDRKINSPLTCGAGRYFDAVAALLGLCLKATFQAEGPMRLESAVAEGISGSYPFSTGPAIGTGEILRGIVQDIVDKTDSGIISAKFHNTVICLIFETVTRIRDERGMNRVALSGGVFQNRYLFEGACRMLRDAGFEVFTHEAVPCNDGGIALGQLAVAAAKRKSLCV